MDMEGSEHGPTVALLNDLPKQHFYKLLHPMDMEDPEREPIAALANYPY